MDLVAGLVVRRTGSHHVEELRELDLSATVFVEFSNHLIDSLSLGLDTEGVDGNFQF